MLMKIIYLFLIVILYIYFPDHFNSIKHILQNFGIKIAYNIIYFYGVCQIKCNQIYNYISPYLKKRNIFLFISNNSEVTTNEEPKIEVEVFDIGTNTTVFKNKMELDKMELDKMELDKMELDKIEFLNPVVILMSDIKKKILYDLELENYDNQFELSDISFIALYLNYNNARYHINLKTDKYNYYLVGNVINKFFLQYYINTVLNNSNFTIDDKKSYSLELMDHEVNMIYLDIEDSIIIEKNNYHIKKGNDIK